MVIGEGFARGGRGCGSHIDGRGSCTSGHSREVNKTNFSVLIVEVSDALKKHVGTLFEETSMHPLRQLNLTNKSSELSRSGC